MFPGGTPRGKRIPAGSMFLGGTRTRLFHPQVVGILPPVVAVKTQGKARGNVFRQNKAKRKGVLEAWAAMWR